MAQEFAKSFYDSATWRKCREAYITEQHGMCEQCTEPGLIVHHKILLTPENIHDTNITLNFDNLELLCLTCHNKTHGRGGTILAPDDFEFDADGYIIPTGNY